MMLLNVLLIEYEAYKSSSTKSFFSNPSNGSGYIFICCLNGFLDGISVDLVQRFEQELFSFLKGTYSTLL